MGDEAKMSSKFNDDWLKWAVEIEDEAGCDVQAGLNLGQHSGEYLAKSQGYINNEKLISVLQEKLGTILSQEELEEVVDALQENVHNRIREKLNSVEVA